MDARNGFLSYSPDMETVPLPQVAPDSPNQVAITELRRRYDERLACLKEASAANRIAEFMDQAPKLDGQVKAGETF